MKNNGHMNDDQLIDEAPQILYDIDLEQALLGSLFSVPKKLAAIATILRPDDFFVLRHGQIYQVMQKLYKNEGQLDQLTVSSELRKSGLFDAIGGAAYLENLQVKSSSGLHAEQYAGKIAHLSIRRALLKSAKEIVQSIGDPEQDTVRLIADAQRRITQVAARSTKGSITLHKAAVEAWYDEINKRELLADESVAKYVGVPIGYPTIDEIIGGLLPKKLTVFGALSGHGKSAFMINVALNIARQGVPVAIFSLEMDTHEIVTRMISIISGLNSQIFNMPEQILKYQEKIAEAKAMIDNLPIYYDDTPRQNATDIENKLRLMVSEYGVQVAFIDHLGLMSAEKGLERYSKEALYGHNSQRAKGWAKDLNIHIWLLSQLNREIFRTSDKRPQISYLRYSAEIEHNADIVWLWTTPCMFDDGSSEARPAPGRPAEGILYSAKNRAGPRLDAAGVRFDYILSSQLIKEATLKPISFDKF